MLSNIFKEKNGKDPYLENVASILHSTIGSMMPIQNAYNIAEECFGELKVNISNGMFRDGENPRETVMAYYSMCSMLRESNFNNNKEAVIKVSVIIQLIADKFKDKINFTPLEKGICLFGEQVFSECFPKHKNDDIEPIKIKAAEIIFNLASEQGASVSLEDFIKLVSNVSAKIGNTDIYKAGDKVLAILALSNITGYSIDHDEINMANIYANCVNVAFNKYIKEQNKSFDDYQNNALNTILKGHVLVLKELMECNTRFNEAE